MSKWAVAKVKDMQQMFDNCSSLTSLPDIAKWKSLKVESMYRMFYNCLSLSSIPDFFKWSGPAFDQTDWFKNCFSVEFKTYVEH